MDQQPITPGQPIQPTQPVQTIQPQTPSVGPAESQPQMSSQAPMPVVSPMGGAVVGGSPMRSNKPRKYLKFVAITLLSLGILTGGSAAAYFGIVLPNKPENVLKSAIQNTLKQTSISAKMKLEGSGDGMPGFKAEADIKTSSQTKASSMGLKVTISGVALNGEIRYVDNNAYFKIGDVSNITDLVGAYVPDYAAQAKTIKDKVTNKWYEVDSTLIKQTGVDCTLNADVALTNKDYEVLTKLFKKYPFVDIASSEADKVDGKAATKFVLNIDSKKGTGFIDGLSDTSVIKKINNCDNKSEGGIKTGDQDITKQVSKAAENTSDIMPITLWVSKDTKMISKVAIKTTAKQEKEGLKLTADMTMDYSEVKIAKPEGAKPVMTLLTDLNDLFPDQPVLGAKIERLIP